jgi:hypothetical protein
LELYYDGSLGGAKRALDADWHLQPEECATAAAALRRHPAERHTALNRY